MLHRQFRALLIVLLFVAASCTPIHEAASNLHSADNADRMSIDGLGTISFPNSGAAEAQETFTRGVLLLHSFEYEPSAEAFREAQSIDPDFTLAYWGEAMTHNHPLWRQKDVEAAQAILARYGATPAERRERAPTERERMYLDAVEVLYGDGNKAAQDHAYMRAMERLSAAYPDDHEARAFYGLSILGSVDGSRDFATYMRGAAVAQPVFEANPDHPGAAHYLIHSFDDPIHAPLGLPAARLYSEIAPGAAHAQHMTTHIFVALGMWEDVVSGNIRARDVQDAQRANLDRPPNRCGHYSSWLHYGHLMLGEVAEAERLMDLCYEGIQAGNASEAYFAAMRARHILDTEDWSLASRWSAELGNGDEFWQRAAVIDAFTNAFAAVRTGDPGPARAFANTYGGSEDQQELVLALELSGLLAISVGQPDRGIDLLREAAALEDSLPFEFGPPAIVKPSFELLGEELLKLERYEEARAAFQRATERTPGRTLAVRGLEASTASGG